MKNNKLKIALLALVVFFVAAGGLFYYASTKLNPEEIRKIAIEKTQEAFPFATVELGQVEIGWGLNFKVHLQKFILNTSHPTTKAKIEMMAVDEMVVKVPIWAIITNGGVVEIQVDKPLMNYTEFQEGNNWTYAMGGKKEEEAKTPEEKAAEAQKNAEKSAKALDVFGKSKINVKLSDVAVKYTLKDNSNGQINVSRFIVKGLNFESSTAFEIASDSQFVMKDNSKVSFSTIAIGEINIADLVKNGSVTSTVIIKVNNISKTGLDWKFPEITTNLDILLKKDGELSGKILTQFESQNKIAASFKMTKEISLSDINVDIVLKDVGMIMGLDRSIDLSKAKLTAKGGLNLSEDKKINADLNFAIAPGIGFSKDGLSTTTSVNGTFKEKALAVKVKTEAMDGQINTAIDGEFDPNQKFDMNALKLNIKVAANGMKIPEKLIREKLWSKKPNEKNAEAKKTEGEEPAVSTGSSTTGATAQASGEPPKLVNTNIALSWNNISVAGEDFSGRGRIVTSSNSLAVDGLNFKFGGGTGELNQTMKLGTKNNDSNFTFKVKDLNLGSFKAFLPPFIENFTGLVSGQFNGTATLSNTGAPPRYDVNVNVDAKKGEIKKLNISEYVNPILAKIPMAKEKIPENSLKLDGNFETMTMKGRFTQDAYNITSFNFIGINKKVEINGNGTLHPTPAKTSVMEVSFTETAGKVGDALEKNIGSRTLPLRLSGPGFTLKPEYDYTLGKVAKGAMKTKGKEALEKVIDKNIDKVVPEKAREKVKGLLDGFFKKK